MAGLYTKNNLSEDGLNAKEGLEKLYATKIYEDILLFAFAEKLESKISSAETDRFNQIYGLLNEPISDASGNTFLRTKFVTAGRVSSDENAVLQELYTFSDNNLVWFDKFPTSLDTRTSQEITNEDGAPVKVSVNGSLVALSLDTPGTKYFIKAPDGTNVSLPADVEVKLMGLDSKSTSASVIVTVESDGTISATSPFTITSAGSGYLEDEKLEILPNCRDSEDPSINKCFRYLPVVNSIEQVYYEEVDGVGEAAISCRLNSEKYTYRVRFADRDGFFLYDDRVSQYVYLGPTFDTFQPILPRSPEPFVILRRSDSISAENFIQLYNLNGRSAFFSYEDTFENGETISDNLRKLSEETESLRFSFRDFIQNNRIQKTEFDTENNLGTRYNIIEGKNITTNYRLVMRDPDSVLDQPAVNFFQLKNLTDADEVQYLGENVPGIWLWTGEKYQRVFSSDDKPFISQSGSYYLSPALFKFNGEQSPPLALQESGELKYSISTGYYKPGTPTSNSSIKGFDTEIGTLIQNISATASRGGFVFRRPLTISTIATIGNPAVTLKSINLFSYAEGTSFVEARFLYI